MLEWITVYPYGLNKEVDICEDHKNVQRLKIEDAIAGKFFPSLLWLFQRDRNVDMTTGKTYLF